MTKPFTDDPVENARFGITLVDTHCSGCGDFHLASLVRRAALAPGKRVGDEKEFAAAVRRHLEAKLAEIGKPPHVVVAGSTDTWLYTLVLNAVCAVGGEDLARGVTVEIVDQCETPLELCRRFAAAHGLDLITGKGDIAGYTPARPADLVLMHGVLPFFPEREQLSYLHHMALWLSPTGILLCSNQHGERRGAAELDGRIDFTLKSLERLLNDQSDTTPEQKTELGKRIEKAFRVRHSYDRSFAEEDEARRFVGEAGLELVGYRTFSNRAASGQPGRYGERVIFECSPSDGQKGQSNNLR